AAHSNNLGPSVGCEAGTADQYTVQIGLGQECERIPRVDASAIEHLHPAGPALLAQPRSDEAVYLGRVPRCRVLAGTDGPDRLVRNHNSTSFLPGGNRREYPLHVTTR